MGRSCSKTGWRSLVNNEDMLADGNENYFIVNDAIDPMREAMEVGFAGLCSDMDITGMNLNWTMKK